MHVIQGWNLLQLRITICYNDSKDHFLGDFPRKDDVFLSRIGE